MGVMKTHPSRATGAHESEQESTAALNGKSRMVAPQKQRTLSKLMTLLTKSFSPPPLKELTVLEQLLFGTIQEGVSYSRGSEAFAHLISQFHDMNELRVSHVNEVADAMDKELPERELKAKRIIQILQFVFETTYSYDLEQMKKKPLKQAHKQLSKIQGTNDFIVHAVVQRSLGGHALPIDRPMREVLRLVDLVEEAETPEQTQANFEHWIPKAKGLSFCLQLSELAAEPEKKQKTILKELMPSGPSKTKSPKPAEAKQAKPAKAADAKAKPPEAKGAEEEPTKKAPAKKSTKKKA